MSKSSVLKVAVQTPLRRVFDYLPLASTDLTYKVGQRVRVPFGRRSIVGVVVGLSDHSDYPLEKLKCIEALLDTLPLLTASQLKLFQWASDYYCHPVGDVILSSLPKKLRCGEPAVYKQKTAQASVLPDAKLVSLTHEQQEAVNAIVSARSFQPFLLAGVTGSGKTEVYLRVIEAVLAQQKQALVLVPEISLTPQTLTRFQARFDVPVLLLHSGLGDAARKRAWLQASQSEPCIVIGTRSAVFAPLNNLAVIVVDEAHDTSFKQQSRFRYCARDVAVMRAKLLDIPVVLGTATPSLESYQNVTLGKYRLLRLSHRPGVSLLPAVILHDIRNEHLNSGLSAFLVDKIKAHLSQLGQVLIYLNRRGYAPVLICHHCGWTADCKRCDAKLTVHQFPHRLVCHHCGFQRKAPAICESCQQSQVMELGLGTEQLEKVLVELFPDKKVVRVDRDNVRTFNALKKTLAQVHDGDADILIGTQLLVKGHHFERVSLVAAIDVDGALFSADFRAIERLAQSLVQVAGRAGREKNQGEVIIQTHQPEHPSLNMLFNTDYLSFADHLLKQRKSALLPPFQFMATLRAEAKEGTRVMAFLNHAKQQVVSVNKQVEVVGPFSAAMAKKAGVYRANLFIQSENRVLLHQVLWHLANYLEGLKRNQVIKWVLDIDPVEMD